MGDAAKGAVFAAGLPLPPFVASAHRIKRPGPAAPPPSPGRARLQREHAAPVCAGLQRHPHARRRGARPAAFSAARPELSGARAQTTFVLRRAAPRRAGTLPPTGARSRRNRCPGSPLSPPPTLITLRRQAPRQPKRHFDQIKALTRVNPRVIDCIKELCADPANTVVLFSGSEVRRVFLSVGALVWGFSGVGCG